MRATDSVLYGSLTTHFVSLTATDRNGCENFETKTVRMFPVAQLEISPERSCAGEGVRYDAVALNEDNLGSISYVWEAPMAIDDNEDEDDDGTVKMGQQVIYTFPFDTPFVDIEVDATTVNYTNDPMKIDDNIVVISVWF